MTTNHNADDYVPLNRVRHYIPGRPSPSTVYRWWRSGVRGIRLPTERFGGRRFVRRDALAEFLERIRQVDPCESAMSPALPSPNTTSSRTQARSIQQAERQLDDAGL